jgi:pyruvate dehydrogenase phosphatase
VQQPKSFSNAAGAVPQITPQTRPRFVDADEIHSSSTASNGPLQKLTGDLGVKVLEMLTPGQATRKLRRNEESYLVGRGRGVVRYDIVQLPSNDPIEDDHAEKVIEVPQNTTGDAAASSDWMFWGVFDGHRLVSFLHSHFKLSTSISVIISNKHSM